MFSWIPNGLYSDERGLSKLFAGRLVSELIN